MVDTCSNIDLKQRKEENVHYIYSVHTQTHTLIYRHRNTQENPALQNFNLTDVNKRIMFCS